MRILSAIVGFLFSRRMMIFIGLVALSVLIWFLGPRLSLEGMTPLASENTRIVVIVSLFLIWIVVELVRIWRIRSLNRRMIDNLTSSQSLSAITDDEQDDELEIIRQRFEDAMAALRETTVKGRGGRSYLYSLPWYIIIGPPGSGKTTILRNSGLDFPLAERLGLDVLEGVGGTRNCDWWFTDQAVLIDTAGRYTTQDVNAATDAATWRGFLDILKESRPRQPVNGVIIAISLADILVQDERERRRTIEALKARLQELMRTFGTRLPVYVMFTKSDLVAGFAEYFDNLAQEDREQVWGITLDLDTSTTGSAALREFGEKMTDIVARLSSRLPERLSTERDVDRRGRIFAFPEQLNGIRGLLESFLDDVFRPSRYSMQPILRGGYFTSGTQEGTPIDRLMSAYAGAFGLGAGQLTPFRGQGKAYFIHNLLIDVIFRERNLVGRNRNLERRMLLGYVAAYSVCLLLVVSLGVLWYAGWDDAQAKISAFETEIAAVKSSEASYWQDPTLANALPVLDILQQKRERVASNIFEETIGLIGLDPNAELTGPITGAYRRALRTILLPTLMTQMQNDLSRMSRRPDADPDQTRELLALYLGLGNADRFNGDDLQKWMTLQAEQTFPLDPGRRDSVDQHGAALIASWPGPQPLDQGLIGQARQAIYKTPPVDQLFNSLEAEGNRYPPSDLADAVGLSGRQILTSRTTSGAIPQIPYLYTANGFYNLFLRRLPKLSEGSASQDWVLGQEAQTASDQERSQLIQAVANRYVKNYIDFWKEFLSDLDIRGLRDLNDANTVLASLAAPQSPLVQLFTFVADNTELPIQTSAPKPTDAADQSGGSSVGGTVGRLLDSASGAAATVAASAASSATGLANWPGTPISKAFADIHALVRSVNNQPPGITPIQQQMASVYGNVSSIESASDVPKAAYDSVKQRLQNANGRDALTQMSVSAVSQPVPLNRILKSLPADVWAAMLGQAKGYLNTLWGQEVAPECSRAILNRYPVYRDARSETTTVDFGTFFGPSGTLDSFQTTYLNDFIDTSSSPWKNRLVDGQGIDLSTATLQALENAKVVRDTFFRSGTQTPGVDFTLKPTYLDPQAARIAISSGSQKIIYQHEPPRTFKLTWPDPQSDNQVTVTLTDLAGASSSIQASGSWSWFHLFDQLKLKTTGLADKFVLPIEIRDKKATFELGADSVTNPFELPELSAFRCQSGL